MSDAKKNRTKPAETKTINVDLPADIHRKLRIASAAEGITFSEAVARAVNAWSKTVVTGLAIFVIAHIVACGGAVDPTQPPACVLPDAAAAGMTSPAVACGHDNLYWTWTDPDGGEHACNEQPCDVGASCDMHSHIGTCE